MNTLRKAFLLAVGIVVVAYEETTKAIEEATKSIEEQRAKLNERFSKSEV